MCYEIGDVAQDGGQVFESGHRCLEQRRVPHYWKTRKDPLEVIWPQALFEYLVPAAVAGGPPGNGGPGELAEKHLRTFQRRVKDWRLANGPGKEVFFTQDHPPGKTIPASRS